MGVRAPLDVDLEDRLIFGLSPQRFGYVVLAVLVMLAIWSQHWLWPPLRLVACAPFGAAGACLAWGRWRGRPVDELVYDAATYLIANYRLRVAPPRVRSAKPSNPDRPSIDPISICISPGLDSEPWAA